MVLNMPKTKAFPLLLNTFNFQGLRNLNLCVESALRSESNFSLAVGLEKRQEGLLVGLLPELGAGALDWELGVK